MDGVDARALIEMVRDRAGSDDPLVLLETAVTVAADTGTAADAAVEHYVGAARARGLSWTVIGERLGVSKQAARQKYAHRLEVTDPVGDTADTLIIAPRLAACLEAAHAAAQADDSVTGTQHLLLGLLHAGVAATVLDAVGVTRDRVREAAGRLFEPALITGSDGQAHRVVGDGDADHALRQARRLAAGRNHTQLRTEHLLFCLALDPGCSARRVLNDLAVDPVQIKKHLEEWIAPVRRRSRRRRGKTVDGRACSFCGCTTPGPLVTGPGVTICGSCIHTGLEILNVQNRGQHTG